MREISQIFHRTCRGGQWPPVFTPFFHRTRAETFRKIAKDQHLEMDPITDSCITFSLERMEQAEFFTPQTFTGGTAVRSVLERSLADKITAEIDTELQLGSI